MTIQITKQNTQLQNLHCPMTKQYCIVFRTVKCGLVSAWVFRANPNFSICFRIGRTSNFGAAVIIQVFQPFIHYFSEYSCFLLFLLQVTPVLVLLEEGLEAHWNPNNHCSTQFCEKFFIQQIVCFVGLFLWRTKWVTLKLPIDENSQLSNNILICQLII